MASSLRRAFFGLLPLLCLPIVLAVTMHDQPSVSVEFIVGSVASRVESQVASEEKILKTCSCALHACSNAKDPARQCTQRLGNKALCDGCSDGFQVNFEASYVRTPPGSNPYNLSSMVGDAICLHQDLDETFLDLGAKNVKTWTYFGSAAGVMRIWPAQVRLRGMSEGSFDPLLGNCRTYEPRLRPWYTSAVTSGPKDIILLIDTAESMGFLSGSTDRLYLATQLVERLLNYITFADFITVIPFGEYAEEFMIDHLVPASKSAKMEIIKNVKNLRAKGSSSIRDAITRTFGILNKSLSTGKTSGCKKAIFILSDGHSCDNMEKGVCTEEFNGLTSLARTIENGQISLEKSGVSRASIFTFSLGHNAQNGVMRQLACMHNGIWAEYTDADDPLHKLNGFLSFMASLKKSDDIIWSNFYEDDGGLGTMTTATKPVFLYDESQPYRGKVIGVVGHDILVSQLPESGYSYQKVLGKVTNRISVCSSENPQNCSTQILRGRPEQCADTAPADKCFVTRATGHVFYFVAQKRNQKDASTMCKKLGGYLAELRNEEGLLLASAIAASSGSWIGLMNVQNNGWRWMTSQIAATTQHMWAPGFQDPKGVCASVDKRGGMQNVIQKKCSSMLSFICEFTSSTAAAKVCKAEDIMEYTQHQIYETPSFNYCALQYDDPETIMRNGMKSASMPSTYTAGSELICDLETIKPTEELACCNCTGSSGNGREAQMNKSAQFIAVCLVVLLTSL